ncbi:MAG TPA: methionyl-tRNA formyltransferase [Solirubrobacteraceae bacterium]|nr:methionyl-tRNA formyltransferase [Solirubrobacteraceae bacterium]
MRTVFLGTSEFAAAVVERLAASEHRPVLVLTRPDRPKGRGRKLASPPVAEVARRLGIELGQPESVNDEAVSARIAAVQPGAVIVCAFGALIKEPLLSEHELLNVHPSLLPRWRGAAPIERALMAGDAQTGVSIMRLTAGLDSGPVCLTEVEPIEAQDTFGSLSARLQQISARLLIRALEQSPVFVEQPDEGVTYAEKIGPEDRQLDPARDARELERVVRALQPHVGARAQLADGTQLGVHSAALAEPGALDPSLQPGVREHEGRLLLVCRTGTLELLVVQPPGGRAMDAGAFLRGRGLPDG